MTETPRPTVQPELTDGVVSLRPWRADDAQWVYESCQDPEVQRWTRVAVPYLMKDAEGFVGPFASHQWSSGRGAPFAVIDAASGKGIGAAGFVINDSTSRVAEAGYWTSAVARGRGLAPRALELLSTWALHDAGIVRLELLIEEENSASRKVAERAGYSYEGLLVKKVFHRGQQRNVAIYARTDQTSD
ncbi:MAG: GNAT family N-acetyltransferase [Acidimicrobiales bacterium]